MGPQAWAAVAKALGLAMARWALDPAKGGAAILIYQVRSDIMEGEFENAKVKMRHLKRHHTELYEDFLREFGDDLDSEELSKI